MADITDYVSGTPFTLRVRSSLATNRRVRWFNTWELRAISDGDIALLEGFASAMVGFHSSISYNYVYVDEVTISSWEPDSHPYNPLGFATVVYNQIGLTSVGFGSPVSLRNTLFCKRAVQTGLQGKLFLRGALVQSELAYGDGEWQLEDPADVNTRVQNAITVNGIEEYMMGLGGTGFALCMMGEGGETRFLSGLQAVGTSDVKLNHKYFDRAP
jgi:hypothetical protein